MFTGIVTAIGTVVSADKCGTGMELCVELRTLPRPPRIGDSVALSGVCCTVTEVQGAVARFHLSAETLDRTWLGRARPGTRLNLEGALCAGDPLGGHLVQGHVDGLADVTGAIDAEAGGELWVRIPERLLIYCVEKGSISLDGVSLTIAAQDGDRVMIAIIPHTAQVTTLGPAVVGDPVHVEVDVLAKYVENMLAARFGDAPPGAGT